MAQTAICEYGKKYLSDVEQYREYFRLESLDTIIEELSNKTKINLKNYNHVITKKSSEKGFDMKWHIDDIAVIKTKSNNNGIILNNKYKLHYKNDLPIWTAIIYLSDYNIDFTGGEFYFLNQEIKPMKNYVLFFDSREVHRVNLVKFGTRDTILIKFYKN